MIRTGIAALLLRLLIAGNDKNNLERFPASCQCVRYGTINQRIFIGSPHESRFVPSCCCLFSSNGSVLKVVLCVHSTRSSAVIQHTRYLVSVRDRGFGWNSCLQAAIGTQLVVPGARFPSGTCLGEWRKNYLVTEKERPTPDWGSKYVGLEHVRYTINTGSRWMEGKNKTTGIYVWCQVINYTNEHHQRSLLLWVRMYTKYQVQP